jgi:hypothetical protein
MGARDATLLPRVNFSRPVAVSDGRSSFIALTIVGGSHLQENVSQHQLFQNVAHDIFYVKKPSRIIAVIITLFQLENRRRAVGLDIALHLAVNICTTDAI